MEANEVVESRAPLDRRRCYEAFVRHDRRLDGRVFAGVVTTGVYCRPVCPVRPAKFENCVFYACAAAAEGAGFRPCKRCRPEAAPGTPAWLGSSVTVSRALRLIADGALDGDPETALAERLGVSDRHLRRLFLAHLGASPGAVARTQRAHFARRLIVESRLPMSEVAFSSGFASVRQFNATVRASFKTSPRAMRSSRRKEPPEQGLCLRLPFREPLEWNAMLRFLAARAAPGVESVEDGVYRRTIEVDGQPGSFEVERRDGAHVLLRLHVPSVKGLIFVVERVRRLFDLDADPVPVADHLRRFPALSNAVRRMPGLRVVGAWDGFEIAVRAILGQQVSVGAATTLVGRLVHAFGRRVSGAPESLGYLFPTPEVLAASEPSIGVPRARARALSLVARAVGTGEIVLDRSADSEKTAQRLREIPGVGPWTAEYIAMRALGDADVFPAADLGVRRALSGSRPLRSPELRALSEPWRPFRSYASMYLWLGAERAGTSRTTRQR